MKNSPTSIILQVDEFTIKQVLKNKEITNYLKITDEKGKGYISGSINTFKDIENNKNLISDPYISGIFDQIIPDIKELKIKKKLSTRIPTVNILSENEFIKNVKMNYPEYKINDILNKHLTKEE